MATARRKRSSSGWLAWWCAPVGSGPRRRSRSSRATGGPGSLAWWLGNVGSQPAPAYGRITTPPRIRDSKAACPLCHKAAGCRCQMVKGEPIKRPRRRPGTGPYAFPPDFRARGAVWCGNCRRRINTATGRCLNTRCPR